MNIDAIDSLENEHNARFVAFALPSENLTPAIGKTSGNVDIHTYIRRIHSSPVIR